MKWQTIESAPKDGTRVMLTCAGYVPRKTEFSLPHEEFGIYHLALWAGDHWSPFVPNNWTHWMQLPEPPHETA